MNREETLHLIWQHRLFSVNSLKTKCGLNLKVIHPGERNRDAGPDFFNARIKIGELVWAGNVEVHLLASHWNQHGHHLDPAYDNVILHVMHRCDQDVKNSQGRSIPSLVIDPDHIPTAHLKTLSKSTNWLLCQNYLSDLQESYLKRWLESLYQARMDGKIQLITHLMQRYPDNREKAFMISLASGFGLPINSLPFEMMTSGIPLALLREIKDSLPDLEALLFGHSGLLHDALIHDSYPLALWQRYQYLKKEVPATPLPSHLWKFLRIRPASFPTLRLSMFASLIHSDFPLYENLMNFKSIAEIEGKLHLASSSYWNSHYIFGTSSPHLVKKLGNESILHLFINVIIPFWGADQKKDPGSHDPMNSNRILLKLKAESNHIIKKWSKFGLNPGNAFESQALLHLYNTYCKQKRCKDCQIGKMNPNRKHEE